MNELERTIDPISSQSKRCTPMGVGASAEVRSTRLPGITTHLELLNLLRAARSQRFGYSSQYPSWISKYGATPSQQGTSA